MINLKKDDAVADAIREILQQEALKGDQHEIDANKNNKIDSHDFKLLRAKKEVKKEEVEQIDELVGKGQLPAIKKAHADAASTAANKMDTVRSSNIVLPVPKEKSAKINALDFAKKHHAAQSTRAGALMKKAGVKEEVEVVYEANIEPTSAKSRSHISNLSNPITNTVTHPSSGKEIGIITKQPSGEYYAHHSAAKLSHAESGTFDSKDKAHQFIRNAHAKAIKNNTLSDRWNKQKKLPQFAKEEVEQLDELSKSTLGSYTKKASRDATITRKIGADFENDAKRSRSPGMKAAANSLSDKYKSKSWKRKAGIDKAVDRLTKEDVEGVKLKTLSQFKEGWSEMLADVKKRAEPQPSGGSGIKQGSHYGGSKQKPDKPDEEKKK